MNYTTERQGFCLGCGKLFERITVNHDGYHTPPQVAHPTWCRDDACRVAREKFRKVTAAILYPPRRP